ncbi:MAG: (4Fe-4S)-binding protein [Bacteroidota bacterium]
MAEKVKTYTNGEVSIVWKPERCIHSEKCWRGLSSVFDPKARPWINAEGASTEEIVAQVKQCPSGALSTIMDNQENKTPAGAEAVKVNVLKDGPLIVHSSCTIIDADGNETQKDKQVAFCRCGASNNKPYCDGSHRAAGFEG